MGRLWYEATGVTQITALERVKRGSFYYYYDSKVPLTSHVLDGEWEIHRREVYDPAFSSAGSVAEKFLCFADGLHAFQRTLRGDAGSAVGWPFADLGRVRSE